MVTLHSAPNRDNSDSLIKYDNSTNPTYFVKWVELLSFTGQQLQV